MGLIALSFGPVALPERIAAVDDEGGAGNVARSGGGKKNRERADLLRLAWPTHRNGADEGLNDRRVLLRPFQVRLCHKEAGTDGVDGHTPRRPVGGGGAGEMD